MEVLIAEDNKLVQRLLIRTLSGLLGTQIDTANNGKEAIKKALTRAYDVCLMDINMPLINGYEATKEIRANLTYYLPIIAHSSSYDEQTCIQTGFDDFVGKNQTRQLIDIIHSVTGKQISLTINKNNNTIDIIEEQPMNKDQFEELRDLTKQGLVKLVIRGTDHEFITHENILNYISVCFVKNKQEVCEFLNRDNQKPALCHLYNSTLSTATILLTPEDLERRILEENKIMAHCKNPELIAEENQITD